MAQIPLIDTTHLGLHVPSFSQHGIGFRVVEGRGAGRIGLLSATAVTAGQTRYNNHANTHTDHQDYC